VRKTKTYPNDFRWLAKQRECLAHQKQAQGAVTKTCRNCQKDFQTSATNNNKVFCCKACNSAYNSKKRTREYFRKRYHSNREKISTQARKRYQRNKQNPEWVARQQLTSKIYKWRRKTVSRDCLRCGCAFSFRINYKPRNKTPILCKPCSAVAAQEQRNLILRGRAALTRAAVLKTCGVCGLLFHPLDKSSVSKYCSPACGKAISLLKGQFSLDRRRLRFCERHYAELYHPKVCSECGSVFHSEYWHQKFCSKQCKMRAGWRAHPATPEAARAKTARYKRKNKSKSRIIQFLSATLNLTSKTA
jgi:hypothetical protein